MSVQIFQSAKGSRPQRAPRLGAPTLSKGTSPEETSGLSGCRTRTTLGDQLIGEARGHDLRDITILPDLHHHVDQFCVSFSAGVQIAY